MKLCLYNTYSDNVVGYCHYHECHVTKKQMECKNCLGKQCGHFEKNLAHQIWHQKEAKKQKRKQRKERLNNYVNSFKTQY